MRVKVVFNILGVLICCVGITMLVSLGFSLYYNDDGISSLLYSLLFSIGLGGAFLLATRNSVARPFTLNHREGMTIVALGWLFCGIVGALPYVFYQNGVSFVDGFFEAVSGFTTTGASIFTDIEAWPKGLLFWRAWTHWLGGMGIIVFSLAILPYLGVGGMQMYKAEVASPVADKLHPRLHDTAISLWKVYLFFSMALTVLLMFGGMDIFDALCHSFAAIATGGFSTKNASVGYYNSVYIYWVLSFFMYLAGANFGLHFKALSGKPGAYVKSTEFVWYTIITLAATLIIGFSLYGREYAGLEESMRQSAFQVTSILTTTGSATADYTLWNPMAQGVIFLLFFIGGCAGSTAGGLKVVRIVTLIKVGYNELFRMVHPRSIRLLKMNGISLPPEIISSIVGFTVLYLTLLAFCSFLLTACGVDIAEAFSGVLSCLGNVGPAFGSIGPAHNYAQLPDFAKVVLSFAMLLGRLEVCTIFILFIPEFWRK